MEKREIVASRSKVWKNIAKNQGMKSLYLRIFTKVLSKESISLRDPNGLWEIPS
jgi:hypothetical protein